MRKRSDLKPYDIPPAGNPITAPERALLLQHPCAAPQQISAAEILQRALTGSYPMPSIRGVPRQLYCPGGAATEGLPRRVCFNAARPGSMSRD